MARPKQTRVPPRYIFTLFLLSKLVTRKAIVLETGEAMFRGWEPNWK